MRYLSILIVLSSCNFFIRTEDSYEKLGLINELHDLAYSKDLEFVYGEKFPEINPYGSYGSTFIFDFIENSDEELEQSVMFLCRRKNQYHKNSEAEYNVDMIKFYDYFLVFAIKEKNSDLFEVSDIIENGIGLMGMSLYYGKLNLDLSQFRYVEDTNSFGPNGVSVDSLNESIPIVISSVSSTKILIYYKKMWLEYVEIEM